MTSQTVFGSTLMFIFRIIFIALLSFIAPITAFAEKRPPIEKNPTTEEKPPITVVELYTSQGCYSCPPADELLGELKEKSDIIALSCHVTYWNYLGWKDTFSTPFCDYRQRNYQRYLKGRAGVYTPQIVINGRYGVVGSQRRSIHRIIHFAQQQTPILPIDLSINNQQLEITLPKITKIMTGNNSDSLQIYLMATSGDHLLPIAKGENGGKKLPYYNPVEVAKNLGSKKLGDTIYHDLPNNPDIKEWVAIAQERPLGKIVAAGKLKIHQ